MTIDEIKSIDLIEWLKLNGYGSGTKKGTKYWYLSPLRNESTPSFRVDPSVNLWYDFGLTLGGNIINLVERINPNWSHHQALSFLEEQTRKHGLSFNNDPDSERKEQEGKEEWLRDRRAEQESQTSIQRISEISHPYLRDYILQRRIDFDIARSICQEVHYIFDGKTYYAIAFKNIAGGFETRNKYFKRCIGRKTISIIRPDGTPLPHCCVFEGFFDLLTYLTIKRWMNIGICIEQPCDYYVLNSTSCVGTLLPYLSGYEIIHSYLDNDDAGRNATDTILKSFPGKCLDESVRYKGYNDLNDVINGITIRDENG